MCGSGPPPPRQAHSPTPDRLQGLFRVDCTSPCAMMRSDSTPGSPMLDNVQIAILSKVNELADRFGIQPHEFVAVVDNASDQANMILRYDVPPAEKSGKKDAFDRMLDLLAISRAGHELKGTPQQILVALDGALDVAPRSRTTRSAYVP